MIYRKIVLACLFVLILPALSMAKTVKVAVLPWKVNSAEKMDYVKDALDDMFSSRLGANASVEVARPDLVAAVLGAGPVTDGAALEAGKKLSADYVLYGSITVFGSSISLDAKLLDVAGGKTSPVYAKGQGLDSVVSMVDKVSGDVLALAGVGPVVAQALPSGALPAGAKEVTTGVVGAAGAASGASVAGAKAAVTGAATGAAVAGAGTIAAAEPAAKGAEGFIVKPKVEATPVSWKSAPLDGIYTSMAAADLDHDGKKELFIVSATKLLVVVPDGAKLNILKEFDAPGGYVNVSVAAIDSDNDGSIEVYLSRVSRGRPSTEAIEFKDGAYRETVTGIDWLVRVIRPGKGAPVLIGQNFLEPGGFIGRVVQLARQGASVVVKGTFAELPSGIDLYRFGLLDLTGGAENLVAVGSRNYLRVYSKGEKGGWVREWESTEYYGGTLNSITSPKDNPSAPDEKPIPIEGAFYHTDTNNDGVEELIIKRNVPGGLGRWSSIPSSFKEAEIYSLSWDKTGATMLKENWKTKTIDGYVADFFITGLENGGEGEITMLVVDSTGKLFGTPKTYVLSYRVSI